jgi:peptidoglycan/xylan/chitin deacetylase (PgdA/CDA1 family)
VDVDRRTLLTGALAGVAAVVTGCSRDEPQAAPPAAPTPTAAATTPTPAPSPPPAPPTAEQVLARATVPVLCYHQLRDWRPADGDYARRLLICPPKTFRAQLDALAEDGWTTIGPDQYLAHLTGGQPLPAKPVILSFDDAQGTQATEALPQLVQRQMTGTFFAMTVVLDKRDWLGRDDLKRLADAGMTVGAHTWDHQRVDRYGDADWAVQLDQPRELLESVLGRPVEHFAYPFGAWNSAAFPHLISAGYRTAFQLTDKPTDPTAPVLSLRRTLVDSTWTRAQLLATIRSF